MTTSTIEQRRAIHDSTADRRQEKFALATANTASASVTLYGGEYIFGQACTTYGTVALRYQAPDGTMVVLVTKGALDVGGGTSLRFAAGAVVDVLLTGTAGCIAILSRVPNA